MGVCGLGDLGDVCVQACLPFLEFLPVQKADGLVVCKAILSGILRIESVDFAADRLRGRFVFLEHFRRKTGAAKIGFILAL